MRRRSIHYDVKSHISRDRWMVSYADFITLLFGFFVVMYAVAIVNDDGGYGRLSVSIAQALKKPPDESTAEKAPATLAADESKAQRPTEPESRLREKNAEPEEDVRIRRMADSVRQALQPWIETGIIGIDQSAVRLEIDIKASVLYDSGSADLAPDAEPILEIIADILKQFPNAIHIEGFTDDQPISNLMYPSNWELSTARAAAVVRLFAGQGIDPRRMAAIGYGRHRPVVPNTGEANRARNRRVVVVVLQSRDPRQFVEIVD